MLKVVNVSGEQPLHQYFCRSAKDAKQALQKILKLFAENEATHPEYRVRALELTNIYLSMSPANDGCYERFLSTLEAVAARKRLMAARAKFASHNEVVCDEDYPEHLRLTNVESATASNYDDNDHDEDNPK